MILCMLYLKINLIHMQLCAISLSMITISALWKVLEYFYILILHPCSSNSRLMKCKMKLSQLSVTWKWASQDHAVFLCSCFLTLSFAILRSPSESTLMSCSSHHWYEGRHVVFYVPCQVKIQLLVLQLDWDWFVKMPGFAGKLSANTKHFPKIPWDIWVGFSWRHYIHRFHIHDHLGPHPA